ncbi:glycoside hydrolase family 27 protein, partial [bacterium]
MPILLSLLTVGTLLRPFHAWASTPPMGWNSWDCFGTGVTEAQTRDNAAYMAANLKRHGYDLITVDIDWFVPGAKGFGYTPGVEIAMDGYGRPLPALDRFPSAAQDKGFKPLADWTHRQGLKFGVHLLRGIPRKAVEKNLPILGTSYHAADIANKNDVCPWNPDMYGVDMTKPGAQAWYDSLFALLAKWGVDFVKVDDLSRPYHQPEVEAIRKAIDKTGRRMVFSTSPGATPLESGPHVQTHANMWRVSDDFWDSWDALKEQFERLDRWTPYRGAGHWPDADMIPLGAVRVGQRDEGSHFTPTEGQTLMTLWSIARSPLILGGHLPKTDATTLALITNDEVISVNRTSKNNRQIWRRGDQIAWVADVPKSRDKYVALFNAAEQYRRDDSRAAFRADLTRNTPGQAISVDVDTKGAKRVWIVA